MIIYVTVNRDSRWKHLTVATMDKRTPQSCRFIEVCAFRFIIVYLGCYRSVILSRGNRRGRFGHVMCDVLKQQVTYVGGYKVRCN
jgi:hypothetical protein